MSVPLPTPEGPDTTRGRMKSCKGDMEVCKIVDEEDQEENKCDKQAKWS